MSEFSRFAIAFERVLSKEIDRGILVCLHHAGKELRYEELRRMMDSPHPQSFQNALDRLMGTACVARRLKPTNDHQRSYYRPTARGMDIARILIHLAEDGRLPEDVDPKHLHDAKRVFLGERGTSHDAVVA